MLKRILLFSLLAFSLPAVVYSQKLEFAPGMRYDSKLPSLKQVTGYDFGERITSPENIIRYFKILNEAAPDRTRLVKYAESWEGRELYALIIADPEKFRRLDEIKAGLRRLAGPTAASLPDEERLVKELPVVVALLHGVHGNEISSGEAAMAEAYHLLAAQGDATVDLIRRETIVIIDPMQNPDGRARFVFQNLIGQAATPDPEPASIEHDEPWPGGRSNHYLFDLNRDWYAQLHPESQGRVKLLLEWMPQVVVDLHEMGGESTYYFPPAADPPNPLRTMTQQSWFEVFGKEIAARFDQRGFTYFNREVYDSFYPGYGASWPILQGAIGMTFEMASARGLAFRRRDDSILTYLDGAVRHFTAALATAATAARNREKLLRDFISTRRTAGAGAVKAYLLPPGNDRGQTQRLVDTLQQNGVSVLRSSEPIKVEGRTLPVGTFIVPLPQPAGMLARNLLDPLVPMNEAFVKRQDDRRKKRLPDQIYDITAWNLPMLYDVECIATDRPITAKAADQETVPAEPATLEDATVGYLLPWNATSASAVIEALNNGIRARFLHAGFTVAGRKYDRGAAIIRKAENDGDLRARLGAIIARHRANVNPLNSAFIEEGISLGSNQVVPLKTPRVLLIWDAPAGSLSAGWTRFTLEQRYRQGATAVRVSSLSRIDLRRYDVIVLPAGNYSPALSGENLRRIKDWVSAGGTLITIGEASRWASRESVGLLEAKTELRDGTPESEAAGGTAGADKAAKQDSANKSIDYERSIQPLREQPELTPGALLRVKLDPEHWLAAGTDGEIQALVESTRVFTPIKLDKGRNVGVYAVKERILASGLIWEEAMNQLPQKAYLIHQPLGGGHLISFAEEPNYRAYTEATMLLFINAVLFGPAY
jgi:Zinc carboxypeptidase